MHDYDRDEEFSPEPAVPEEEPLEVLPVAPEKKGHAVLAWTAIILVVGFIFAIRIYREDTEKEGKPERPTERDEMGLLLLRMQGRYFVGAANLMSSAAKELYPHVQGLNKGPVEHRLAVITLAGELAGPEEAEKQLEELDSKLRAHKREHPDHKHLTPEDASTKDILQRLYADYAEGEFAAPSVSDSERLLVRNRLDWFGELALAPAQGPDKAARQAVIGSATRTFVALFSAVVGLGLVAVVGFVGLILFLIFLFNGSLQTGIHCGSTHGSVYAETFALYLITYFGLNFGLSFVHALAGWTLPVAGASALFSLVALAWPVVRGIPWRQVREEIGLTMGRKPALEPLVGVGGYAITLPILGVGVAIMLVLLLIAGSFKGLESPDEFSTQGGLPYHPIVLALVRPNWWVRLQVLVLACVVAPIVEETMFRGVLYRHLRESSWRLGFFLSVMISAVVVSFVFAVIHPQGLIAVPALMALAFGFSLVREWRGTLIPGMVAHGLNNGLALCLAILAFGD